MNHNSHSLYISHTCPKNFFGVLVVGACCLLVDSGGFLIILFLYGPIVIISQLRCVDNDTHMYTQRWSPPEPDHVETRVLLLLLSSCGTCATAVAAPQNQ